MATAKKAAPKKAALKKLHQRKLLLRKPLKKLLLKKLLKKLLLKKPLRKLLLKKLLRKLLRRNSLLTAKAEIDLSPHSIVGFFFFATFKPNTSNVMDNYMIAENFSLLAKLMDIHGDNSFKAKSYASAAFTIDKIPTPLAELSS
jgi:hypothetical protein